MWDVKLLHQLRLRTSKLVAHGGALSLFASASIPLNETALQPSKFNFFNATQCSKMFFTSLSVHVVIHDKYNFSNMVQWEYHASNDMVSCFDTWKSRMYE